MKNQYKNKDSEQTVVGREHSILISTQY